MNFGDPRLPERFWAKCIPEPNTGCWLWFARREIGYGYIRVDRKNRRAHRLAYEALVGAVPDGLQLDHLCRVRCCVNPAHLEPVTAAVNVRRGLLPSLTRARHAAITHCPRGHEYTPENTRQRHAQGRECRECVRELGRIRVQNYRTRLKGFG